MNDSLIEIRRVTKRYNGTIAVNGVDLDIPRGVIFGLLGPNGAGKTSLIRILTRITIADEGEILFQGERLNDGHTRKIGYMPEERGLYKGMKFGEHLIYLARLRGLDISAAKTRLDEWIERFEISGWWNKRIDELSKGMQQVAQFIATVIHNPNLLIFDEPFSGLDPINTSRIQNEILRLNAHGATVLFSTHRMEQVEEICRSIALMNKGRLVLHGEVRQLKQQYRKNLYRVHFQGDAGNLNHSGFRFTFISEDEMQVSLLPEYKPNDLLNYLVPRLEILSFTEVLPSLNDIFIEQVKRHNQPGTENAS